MVLGSLVAGLGSAFLSSRSASKARRLNEDLLRQIQALYSQLGLDALGGEAIIQEGQEKPLDKKAWLEETFPGMSGKDIYKEYGQTYQALYDEYVENFVPSDRVTRYQEGDFDRMKNYLEQRLTAADAGFNKAQGQLSRAADASRTQAYDLNKQTMAEASQRAISSGRYNTSFLDNAQRGIAADTSRRLQEIDSRLAGMQSDLTTRQAGVKTQLLGDIANMYGQKAGFRQQSTGSLASILGDTTYTSQPLNLGGLGNALDSLFGAGTPGAKVS